MGYKVRPYLKKTKRWKGWRERERAGSALLFQRVRVGFLAPVLGGSRSFVTPALGGYDASGLCGTDTEHMTQIIKRKKGDPRE